MIAPHNKYKSKDFKIDLIQMMTKAGCYGKGVCFLFPDNHVMEESFLEDLNNLLNTGEVPNLYERKDDKENLDKEINEEIRK